MALLEEPLDLGDVKLSQVSVPSGSLMKPLHLCTPVGLAHTSTTRGNELVAMMTDV